VSTERFVWCMTAVFGCAFGVACGYGYGSYLFNRPAPAAERVRQHFPRGLNLPPGTLIVEPHGGMLFIPDDLGGRQKADVAPISNSYVRRLYCTPEGCILPVWAPANCGMMKRGELLFALFTENFQPIMSNDVFDNP
jgi:hypothetical protein